MYIFSKPFWPWPPLASVHVCVCAWVCVSVGVAGRSDKNAPSYQISSTSYFASSPCLSAEDGGRVNPGAEAEAIRAASCLSQGVCESDYLRYDLEYLCFFLCCCVTHGHQGLSRVGGWRHMECLILSVCLRKSVTDHWADLRRCTVRHPKGLHYCNILHHSATRYYTCHVYMHMVWHSTIHVKRVCMCSKLFIPVYAYTCHLYMYVHTQVYIHMQLYIHVYTYICTRRFEMFMRWHTCISTHVYLNSNKASHREHITVACSVCRCPVQHSTYM